MTLNTRLNRLTRRISDGARNLPTAIVQVASDLTPEARRAALAAVTSGLEEHSLMELAGAPDTDTSLIFFGDLDQLLAEVAAKSTRIGRHAAS